jgi:hypothetical protein
MKTKVINDALQACAPLTRVLFAFKSMTVLCCSGNQGLASLIERASKGAKGDLGDQPELRGSSTVR